jgi:hypothetical protein
MTAADASYTYPDHFDDAEVAAKGYFGDLSISYRGSVYKPEFYDLTRFAQDAEQVLAHGDPCYAEKNLVILPEVSRVCIDRAIRRFAASAFAELAPE